MAQTIVTANAEEDRQARQLLKRIASDGPVLIDHANKKVADLLVKFGMAEHVQGGTHLSATPKGHQESKARILSGRP